MIRRMGYGLAGVTMAAGMLVAGSGSAQAALPTCTQSLALSYAPRANSYTVMPGRDGGTTCGLVEGNEGEGVRALQRTLNKCYGSFLDAPLVEDGDFGDKTRKGLSEVQRAIGVLRTEEYDSATRYKMERRASKDGTNTFAYCYVP